MTFRLKFIVILLTIIIIATDETVRECDIMICRVSRSVRFADEHETETLLIEIFYSRITTTFYWIIERNQIFAFFKRHRSSGLYLETHNLSRKRFIALEIWFFYYFIPQKRHPIIERWWLMVSHHPKNWFTWLSHLGNIPKLIASLC